MNELNPGVFYTTAQVKDMVDLSDQNVRKYVRLLEDRDYNVAKDEHNRRLFSANDVNVLKELIKLAKKPGYTLETAADEIVDNVKEFVDDDNQSYGMAISNQDIHNALNVVLDKLDEIQEENKTLKDNLQFLVQRLESYGSDVSNVSNLIEHQSLQIEEIKQTNQTYDFKEAQSIQNDEETVEDTNSVVEDSSPTNEESSNGMDNIKQELQETNDDNKNIIDVSSFNNDSTTDKEPQEGFTNEQLEVKQEENSNETIKESTEKKGLFNKIFGMFGN